MRSTIDILRSVKVKLEDAPKMMYNRPTYRKYTTNEKELALIEYAKMVVSMIADANKIRDLATEMQRWIDAIIDDEQYKDKQEGQQ